MLVDALHLSAMIVWLGGLALLAVAAVLCRRAAGRTGSPTRPAGRPTGLQLAAALPVFSRVAMACIATLAVTGTLQAWREVGALDALAGTRYGQLVLVKVVLFCTIVGLGYLARRAVLRSTGPGRTGQPDAPAAGPGPVPDGTEPVPAGGGTATALSSRVAVRAEPGLPERLRRTLLVEVAVGALVLAATAVLVSQPPGKVALAAERSKAPAGQRAGERRHRATVRDDAGRARQRPVSRCGWPAARRRPP